MSLHVPTPRLLNSRLNIFRLQIAVLCVFKRTHACVGLLHGNGMRQTLPNALQAEQSAGICMHKASTAVCLCGA